MGPQGRLDMTAVPMGALANAYLLLQQKQSATRDSCATTSCGQLSACGNLCTPGTQDFHKPVSILTGLRAYYTFLATIVPLYNDICKRPIDRADF